MFNSNKLTKIIYTILFFNIICAMACGLIMYHVYVVKHAWELGFSTAAGIYHHE